jgi:para-aminobenzoate synthetase component 1
MKFYHFDIDNVDPVSVFSKLYHQPYSLFFDSADTQHPNAKYSYVAYAPFETIESKDGVLTITNNENKLSFKGCAFEMIQQRLDTYTNTKKIKNHKLPPFQGGAAGFFGYDLARQIEILPNTTRDHELPDMAIGLYNTVYGYNHDEKRGYLMVHALDKKSASMRFEHFKTLLGRQRTAPSSTSLSSGWTSSHTQKAYEDDVQRVIDYIYNGDIFQTNISQRFEASIEADFCPFSHYEFLRQINKAPFSSYMNFGDFQLASSSPERFLLCNEEKKVETKPIKGTRPRYSDPVKNDNSLEELKNSEKEHAENSMIVDLLRNDLSRVCEDHSINVSELCAVESFASVHHLVSTITGVLRADRSPLDLLKNAFPGGSITGAPKIRAMEIIEELEDKKRGPYCGSMGYIDYSGYMDTNIVIRTLVYTGSKVSLNVGGGLVADSIPSAEYQETLDKAVAIFNSFDQKESTICGTQKEAA